MLLTVHISEGRPPHRAQPPRSDGKSANLAARNAGIDLFGKDFDGQWKSSDGKAVQISETDGVFEVNGVPVDNFMNFKSKTVEYNNRHGVYTGVSNADKTRGHAIRFQDGLLWTKNVQVLCSYGPI